MLSTRGYFSTHFPITPACSSAGLGTEHVHFLCHGSALVTTTATSLPGEGFPKAVLSSSRRRLLPQGEWFDCAFHFLSLPFAQRQAAGHRSQGRFNPPRDACAERSGTTRPGGSAAILGSGMEQAGRGARRLPSAALRGARKIAANSPSALLKPQVTDNYSAHLLRPI